MDRKSLFTGLLIGTTIGIFAFVLFALGFASNPSEVSEMSDSSGITFTPVYYVTQVRSGEVIYEAYVGNLITNNGLNLTRSKLSGVSSVAAVDYIGVSNDTAAPAITDINLSKGMNADADPVDSGGEYTGCGLARAQGTVTYGREDTADDAGNWSLSYKWTSTCDNINVWKFGVFNGSAVWNGDHEDVAFSIGNFTANVSMQSSDELTINVTYIVS